MPTRICYVNRTKNHNHWVALLKGFKASEVDVSERVLREADLHVLGGLQNGSLELLMEARLRGLNYVFVDRAYFHGGKPIKHIRVVPNAYQQHWQTERPKDRWEALKIELAPWRESCDGYVLLVPPSSPNLGVLFGLSGWGEQMVHRLSGLTKREIRVSKKNDPKPLDERLAGAHCVVTWTSNVAVDAIVAGVPVFCSEFSAARPVALPLEQLERIESPARPEREAWAASLSYGQFTLEEVESGYAAEVVLG